MWNNLLIFTNLDAKSLKKVKFCKEENRIFLLSLCKNKTFMDLQNNVSGLSTSVTDSFQVPTYLFFKGDERLGRNDAKVAGQAGKGESGLPLTQCILVKTASGATGNKSASVISFLLPQSGSVNRYKVRHINYKHSQYYKSQRSLQQI